MKDKKGEKKGTANLLKKRESRPVESRLVFTEHNKKGKLLEKAEVYDVLNLCLLK